MNFYTSDTHFGHHNILKHCKRPFSSTKEMDDTMIQNWNNVVTKKDTVYILGDFAALGTQKWQIAENERILKCLNGNKVLIKGNHDAFVEKRQFNKSLFAGVHDYLRINDSGHKVMLFHYPMMSWDCSFHGSIHLFGHVHNSEITPMPNSYNVGVDVRNFTPVTLLQLLESGE